MVYHYIVSEFCNMKCTYCNVDTNNKIQLSLTFFKEFIKEISGENYEFHIFGGEVFLNDNIRQMVDILKFEDNCSDICITTNGTVFNDEVKYIMVQPKVRITLSHDGLKQTKNRGEQKIHDEFFKFGTHSMLTGDDFNECGYLKANHDYLLSLKTIPNFTLVRDIDAWTFEQASNFLIDYEKYVDEILGDDYKIDFIKIPSLIRGGFNSILNFYVNGHSQLDCGVGDNKAYLTILATGERTSCERFTRSDDKIEDKNKYLIECDTCEIRDFCNRGCIYEQIKNKGVIAELCEIYKGMHAINLAKIKVLGKPLLKNFYNFTKGI